jgi:hypothetical protein
MKEEDLGIDPQSHKYRHNGNAEQLREYCPKVHRAMRVLKVWHHAWRRRGSSFCSHEDKYRFLVKFDVSVPAFFGYDRSFLAGLNSLTGLWQGLTA